MYFPFLLTIQLAVFSLAKPIEDGSTNEFDAFPALSDLIPDPAMGGRKQSQTFTGLTHNRKSYLSLSLTQDRSGNR